MLNNIEDATKAGADYVVLLHPVFLSKVNTTKVSRGLFDDIPAKSPLLTNISNFPRVCSGVDLATDVTIAITKNPSICLVVKLTCGGLSKIIRLSGIIAYAEIAIFGGQSDLFTGGLAGCPEATEPHL